MSSPVSPVPSKVAVSFAPGTFAERGREKETTPGSVSAAQNPFSQRGREKETTAIPVKKELISL